MTGRWKILAAVAAVVVVAAVATVLVVVLRPDDVSSVGGPTARITIVPSTGIVAQGTVAFAASESAMGMDASRVSEIRYAWNLGDGTTSTEERVEHRYARPGSYEVSLTLEVIDVDQRFRTDTARTSVEVDAPELGALVADVAIDPDGPWTSGKELTFNGSGSRFVVVPGEDTQLRWTYSWDFGDGTATVQGRSVKHRFDRSGTYTVELTVQVVDEFDQELTATAVRTVTIGNRAPVAVARVSPTGGDDRIIVGRAVMLDATDSYDPDGGPLLYLWDIDEDGKDDIETEDPEYRYEPGFVGAGERVVRLEVKDSYQQAAGEPGVSASVVVDVGTGPDFDFVVSTGAMAMGDLRLAHASVGMPFFDGRFVGLLGFGMAINDVTVDLASGFPAVVQAGYTLSGTITQASAFTVTGYYRVHELSGRMSVVLGGSLGYASYSGTYNASSRVSIGGSLAPVAFSDGKLLIGVGVGLSVGFFIISVQAIVAL